MGKWHLGLGEGHIDWNGEIGPGPRDIGFDRAFFMPATLDRVPTVLIDGRRVAYLDPADPIRVDYKAKVGDEPTGAEHSGTIVNGISRIGTMTGGHAARWKDEELSDLLLGKALDFIRQSDAHLYVCGDASRMARDVGAALLRIVTDHGGMDHARASDYVNAMQKDRRYVRNVY